MHNVGGQITLTKVKTMTAIRTVLMPSFLQDYLDSLFQEQRKDRAKANGHYRDTERVYDEVSKEWLTGGDFINRKHNGELLTVNSMKYWAKKIKAETGIEFRYHNLRHTYASTCAFNNMNMLVLMQMLGHKKPDTTRKYYHVWLMSTERCQDTSRIGIVGIGKECDGKRHFSGDLISRLLHHCSPPANSYTGRK